MKTKPDPAASAPLLPGADGTVAAFGATVAETLKSMTQLTLPVPTIAQLQTDYIQQALAEGHGVQIQAARLLGISERHLRYKLAKYGMK